MQQGVKKYATWSYKVCNNELTSMLQEVNTYAVCLFDFCFTSCSRIFRSYGDLTMHWR